MSCTGQFLMQFSSEILGVLFHLGKSVDFMIFKHEAGQCPLWKHKIGTTKICTSSSFPNDENRLMNKRLI